MTNQSKNFQHNYSVDLINIKINQPIKANIVFSPSNKTIKNLESNQEKIIEDNYPTGKAILAFLGKENHPFLVMKQGEELKDLTETITKSCTVEFLDSTTKEGLEVYRHTTAHVMAYALINLYPQAKLTIGPVIEGGFFYDVDEVTLKEEDLEKIEKEMGKLIAKKYLNERVAITKTEAQKIFQDNPYKLEIINDLKEDEPITYYKMGDFVDLCRGPHIPHIGFIKAFKLQRLAGAYWRGKSSNKMLTRIYATSFFNPKDLKEHLKKLEELKASDHNKLGRDLGFFISNEQVGQGLPLLTPKGSRLKKILENWVEEEETKRGYEFTITPYLAKSDLYKISGHWQHYKENMFVIEGEKGETLALRPMTCPFHFSLYNAQKRSYRELPVRYAENSTLFRNEASGEMHGLIRVRQFTLADGHIMCTPEQVAKEFKGCLELIEYYLKTLELDNYYFRLSKWDPNDPEKYINNPTNWEKTEKQMKEILDNLSLSYVEAVGEAAFYGPKLDIQMKNVHGKEDTIMTVQIDFALPERFNMRYTDMNDQEKRPIVIHRGSLGCYERTIAMLIENYKGKLPFWLAPEQIEILSISDQVHAYAEEIYYQLLEKKLRVKLNLKNDSLGKKIKESQKQKIPCVLTIGKQEQEKNTISLRTLTGEVKNDLKLTDLITIFQNANSKKLKHLPL